jgi:uncharacterized protein YhaN
MRIAQLHLAAFGAFTGRRLDFDTGVGALHVVCGPNEAGKSTTLRALSGFLFGIPMRSDDDFLHSSWPTERGCPRCAARECATP